MRSKSAWKQMPATGLELALSAVPVQDEVGRRGVEKERGDFVE